MESSTYCKAECPLGYYKDIESQTCKHCYLSCQACSGGGIFDCISCKEGYHYISTMCVKNCTSADGISDCLLCNRANCAKCNSTHCIECSTQYYLLHGQCFKSCPKRYFAYNKTHTCEKCHPSCLSCTRYGKKYCSKCEQSLGYTYNLITQTCTPVTCSSGYYLNYIEATCYLCNPNCKECLNESVCTQCSDNTYFKESNTPNCVRCEDALKGLALIDGVRCEGICAIRNMW